MDTIAASQTKKATNQYIINSSSDKSAGIKNLLTGNRYFSI